MNQSKSNYWICCQIGAREHYAIPRALHQTKQLASLITDAWISPTSPINQLPKYVLTNLRERYHSDLDQASIQSFTNSLIQLEITQRFLKQTGWEKIIARNNWFQHKTVKVLRKLSLELANFRYPPIIFSYSYAALGIFRYAKSQGWQTILGQIDPGITHEKIVIQECSKYSSYQTAWKLAPSYYWEKWHQECSLADRIIVNSTWSSQALQEVGIDREKINIIPLAYQISKQINNFQRKYPLQFSNHRPLRVLFLGNVVLNKGIIHLLEAAKLLKDQPIEFLIVGLVGVTKPVSEEYNQVKWIGAVPRSMTASYYQQADVFIFPTLSDGFGLTQLEAQAWKLPIIASRNCGEVVVDGVNGCLLSEVSGVAIAQALKFCLNNPWQLEAFAKKSTDTSCFSLPQLQQSLQALPYAVV
ncbi:MAG: glycosyltransferase family 4 protein [Nostoc sp.]|uniref:glycosyltransferase family 4 protein n=1 Tax=Nostoc sp. TaxID=1180 RepID=UPI002FF25EE0